MFNAYLVLSISIQMLMHTWLYLRKIGMRVIHVMTVYGMIFRNKTKIIGVFLVACHQKIASGHDFFFFISSSFIFKICSNVFEFETFYFRFIVAFYILFFLNICFVYKGSSSGAKRPNCHCTFKLTQLIHSTKIYFKNI